jgi:BirA family biotin operon repressor/biotin-[acetyl-CoA-carboxylase] ligase
MSWDAKLFHRHLTTRRFGRECVWLDEVDSTNRWLADNEAQFTMSGATVVAGHQSAGRGRRDRTWYDKPGASLLFTVLLRHPADSALFGYLGLMPAIALAQCLAERFAPNHFVSLKWPNDVLIRGKKVAGVLGQSSLQGTQGRSFVGVGINVAQHADDFGDEFRQRSTSLLLEDDTEVAHEPLLADILNRWEPLFDDLLEKRFDELKAKWYAFGHPIGSTLTREEAGQTISGTFEGLGEHGQLLLRDEQGMLHELFTGDLS